MILYRHADPRFPFLWESTDQPAGRWHAAGEGPVHYFADTPDGAWAEFLRHEGITEEAELDNVRRALWAVDVPEPIPAAAPDLPRQVLTGGLGTYPRCRAEARRLRATGATALRSVLRHSCPAVRADGRWPADCSPVPNAMEASSCSSALARISWVGRQLSPVGRELIS